MSKYIKITAKIFKTVKMLEIFHVRIYKYNHITRGLFWLRLAGSCRVGAEVS